MELTQYRSVFFLGIGGIGMSALARWCHLQGMLVRGYDRTETPLTQQLAGLGIHVSYSDEIPSDIMEVDLIVRTPAVPSDHPILLYAHAHTIPVLKRAELLGWISQSLKCLSVAGTHGKTSVTAMLTHIMKAAGNDPLAFVGGILKQYDSNVFAGNSAWMIAEADEYDRSFLKLQSYAAIVTAIDPDHLDIYGSIEAFHQGFIDFGKQVSTEGYFIVHESLRDYALSVQHPDTIFYGTSALAEARISQVRSKGTESWFDFEFGDVKLQNLVLKVPGMHNILNAAAAITMALKSGVSATLLPAIISDFQGVRRRMDIRFVSDAVVYIDDYAHHPEEISAVLTSVRSIFPNHHLRIAFQPHLFSRTRDFQQGFAQSLELADEVLLLDIYPARELPMPGISMRSIADHMHTVQPIFSDLDTLAADLLNALPKPSVVMTLGAGNIDTTVYSIVKRLEVAA
jgi:UDP-N-acetylmuramate--alanine ligase